MIALFGEESCTLIRLFEMKISIQCSNSRQLPIFIVCVLSIRIWNQISRVILQQEHVSNHREFQLTRINCTFIIIYNNTSVKIIKPIPHSYTCTYHHRHEIWIFKAFLSVAVRLNIYIRIWYICNITRYIYIYTNTRTQDIWIYTYISGLQSVCWITKRNSIRDSMSSWGHFVHRLNLDAREVYSVRIRGMKFLNTVYSCTFAIWIRLLLYIYVRVYVYILLCGTMVNKIHYKCFVRG